MSLIRSQAYTNAGVNINAGNALISNIKSFVSETNIQGVLSDLGGFGGLFKLNLTQMDNPVLVSSTDGVGTKLKFAFDFNKHDTVGIDLVAMCVNDILVQGARPLFFLDYFATSKLDVDKATQVIYGISEGCKQARCALLGGETAELPGMYTEGEYDLAGFCVGIVDQSKIIDGSSINVGDTIIGLASSGIHSNGYSLVRQIVNQCAIKPDDIVPGSEDTFKQVLLKPTLIYSDIICTLIQDVSIKGMVHITGGGFYDNISRVLPQSVVANIQFNSWDIPPIFYWLQEQGALSWSEMLQIFNCGIGYILIIPNDSVARAMNILKSMEASAWIIGSIVKQNADDEQVIITY